MLTNSGGGNSRWKDVELTRWRADTTRDSYGQFVYVRDLETGTYWSAGHHPVGSPTQRYTVIFSADKAEFRRRDAGIETVMEVVVSPEDDAEIRLITIINRSLRVRRLELTSFAEIALAPHNADRAHPAFSKLFVQTEALPEQSALLAWRRPRAADEPEIWAAHVIAVEKDAGDKVQYESDRAKFIGRGRTARRPTAMEGGLSNSAGAVLDPVFSLRKQIVVEPGQRIQASVVTAAGSSRNEMIAAVDKYCDVRAATRALQMAWTHAQLELRHLRIQQDDAQRFQQLAGFVLYPQQQLRPSPERLVRNKLPQSRLWSHGISGDLPIVLATISTPEDVDAIRDVLMAHSFWRHRGLKSDLVILNEEAASYDQPLNELLGRLVLAHSQNTGIDQPGGVFLRPAAQIPDEEINLFHTVARVVIIGSRGSLGRQISAPTTAPSLPPLMTEGRTSREEPSAPLPFMELPYFNGLGGFTRDGREYAIYLGPGDQTPLPWINVIANPSFGTLCTESGGGFSWFGNSQSNRITPWSNDPVSDHAPEAIYIRDEDSGIYWTPTPLPVRELDAYRARHGQGYTVFEHNSHAIEQELLVFVPVDDKGGSPVRIQKLRLRNRSSQRKRLTITSYCELTLGVDREDTQTSVFTQWDNQNQAIMARNPYHPDFGSRVTFMASSARVHSYTGDRAEFLGRNGSPASPAAMGRTRLSNRAGAGFDPCGALQVSVELESGRETEITFILGQAGDVEEARALLQRFKDPDEVRRSFNDTLAFWESTLSAVQVETPDLSIDFLLNRWLLYQDLSCRMWGRSAFYQSGGAFGFRDQLQDCMALVYAAPQLARDQILRTAARQFEEGDVQHWWHPPSGAGVRTRITDDLLWLPFVTAHYVRLTGDDSILDAPVPFLRGKVLDADEHEAFFVPEESGQSASLMEHCRRALVKGFTSGPHGLPLIGGGDWNDGMNRVGIEGKGESVWLAWFLIHVMKDFAELLFLQEEPAEAEQWRKKAKRLASTIEKVSWDGSWYLRAFFDDGTPLGSQKSQEAQIDSLSQSWSVIAGEGSPERSRTALQSVLDRLFLREHGMLLLFTPPFDETPQDPGYIKGYLPGVRENGGQYTHGSLWAPIAFARMGDGATAVELLSAMNPIRHAREPAEVQKYKVEPYVVAADVYALKGQVGRGGWTWYTGSAGWMYRAWVEEVLGLTVRADSISLNPVIPPSWNGFLLKYRRGSTLYEFNVLNPDHVSQGLRRLELNGKALRNGRIPLTNDGSTHSITVIMGTDAVVNEPDPVEVEAAP
jgi:cellobiose phosphorylase